MSDALTETEQWYAIRLPDGRLHNDDPGWSGAGTRVLVTSEGACLAWSALYAAEATLRNLRGDAENLGVARAFEAARIVVFTATLIVVETGPVEPVELVDAVGVG
ncbi:hypothetical protein [Nocardia brasiliensis]|uniref:hypothetical protein n=1 Tax=Nocardia brasiliensis TaxID=37326 RepID=UPI002455FA2A|nr:hypothetical protein [Nocardia brasiliensis]